MKMKRMKKAVMSCLLGLSLLSTAAPVYANGEASRIITKTFESMDMADTGEAQFETRLDDDGYIYELRDVRVKLLEKKLVKTPMVYESPFFLEDPEGHYPEEVFEDDDGVKYVLLETELLDSHQDAFEAYGDGTISYTKEVIDKIEGKAPIEVEDKSSGDKVVSELPLIESTIVNEYWVDDFAFPITVFDYDADEYLFGDVYVPNGADLYDYKDAFLAYLGLPADYYRIDGIDWDGDAYDDNGIIKRNAVAWGSKKIQEVTAVYGGTVVFEEKDGYVYESQYREMTEKELEAGHPIEGEGYYYIYEAEAEYELIESPSFWDRLLDKLQEIWENLMIWIKEHPVETVCLLFLALIIIILLILSRKKKKEEKEETDEEFLKKEGILPDDKK